MKNRSYNILLTGLTALVITACGGHNGTAESIQAQETAEEQQAMTDVELTAAQVEKLGIRLGPLPQHDFAGRLAASGTIVSAPQGEALVTSYMGANIRRIVVSEGQEVRRGQVVAWLTHPDILDMQSRYLAAYNRLTFMAQEYQRQKTLAANNVGAGREWQKTQSEYRALQGEVQTTAAQLRLLGVNLQALRGGKTTTMIPVMSPIAGTVEQIMMKTGQFADPQQPMMRVVSTSGRLADLLVYEKDIDKVKAGQRVDLWPATPDGQPMRGVVLSVGQTLDAEAKAVHVRVSIGAARGLVTGMYVRGEIAAAPRRSTAIPQDGLVAEDGKTYLFTAMRRQKGWVFHPVEVSKGMEEGGMAEVRTAVDGQVALTGAYDLMSEMKKGETGEHD